MHSPYQFNKPESVMLILIRVKIISVIFNENKYEKPYPSLSAL